MFCVRRKFVIFTWHCPVSAAAVFPRRLPETESYSNGQLRLQLINNAAKWQLSTRPPCLLGSFSQLVAGVIDKLQSWCTSGLQLPSTGEHKYCCLRPGSMRYGPRSVTNPYQLSSRQLRPLAPTYIVRVIVQNFVYRTNIVGASRDQSRVLYIYI